MCRIADGRDDQRRLSAPLSYLATAFRLADDRCKSRHSPDYLASVPSDKLHSQVGRAVLAGPVLNFRPEQSAVV